MKKIFTLFKVILGKLLKQSLFGVFFLGFVAGLMLFGLLGFYLVGWGTIFIFPSLSHGHYSSIYDARTTVGIGVFLSSFFILVISRFIFLCIKKAVDYIKSEWKQLK